MKRSSKNNPYQCPECGYKTARKWNMKVHLDRVHGLAPFLPQQSKSEWVYAQLDNLAKQYVEAELAGEDRKRERLLSSLYKLHAYHHDLFSAGLIFDVVARKRRELEARVKKQPNK